MTATTYMVTGSSGFLGYHVCRFLAEKGYQVRGIDIADFDYPDLKDKVLFFKGDIRDKQMLDKVMDGVDVVMHGAAALPLWSKQDIFTTNVEGTRNVLQAARDRDIKRVAFISSTAVYGIPKQHPVNEDHPLEGVGPYGETKIEAEKICAEFRAKGLCVPVIRPKTFAGPMRLGVFQILCDWVKSGKNIPIIGNGKNRYQLLHVDDLVEAIYLVSTLPADKVNDTFNVGATEFQTMQADLQVLLDFAGFGKHVRPIPAWLVIPVLKTLERFHVSPLYEWVYDTAAKDHYVSVDKIMAGIGWQPRKSTADVWIDTYRWYLTESSQHTIGTGISHRVAWKQGALKFVKFFF
jgi:nucleoside-diphosphate-sugar epimerase